MPKYEELNGRQQRLYDQLQTAMKEGKNIIDLLTGFSEEDLVKILTTVKCIELKDGEEHTLTPLAYAINLENSLNSRGDIKNIPSVVKEKDILEEVLTTANIKIKFLDGQEITLTPLVYAMILNNQIGIDTILDIAKKDKELLEKVLTAANIKIRSLGDQEHTLTPLSCAINFNNQEVSQKSIKAIIDVAQDNDMLEAVFASIKKDYRDKTKNILEILKNQEQDEEQKAKIDGWLEILAKSISSCESNEQSSMAESIVPKTEGNITDESSTSEISIMSDCESNEQSSMAESIVPKTEGNITQDTVKTTNKPIIIGSVCGAIAALAVGLGLYFGAALPILTMIGIAMAAAVLTGLVAGGITYVMSNSSKNLDGANVEQGVSIGSSITA
ncbi:WD_0033/WD_0034 family tandem repeat-containing protein [Wolbachia pipientis]|uniref:WD_0033/WD_0034 family tandem repeat-containing protein n=1 Tax=Wolbachia pipientis TaxID=955 RepID=UPI0020B75258|nr:magnesium transporter [Wolbachia pipientis]